jgi:hypothetical protein
LPRHALVGALAGEVGDDGGLTVGLDRGNDAGRAARPRMQAISGDQQARRDARPIVELQCPRVARPVDGRKRARRDDLDACAVRRLRERGAQRALLDDPGERALADVVRRKIERGPAIAHDPHCVDRRESFGGERLPCADRPQERGTPGADRVDPRVPVAVRRGFRRHRHRRAIGERNAQSELRKRRSQREPDQSRACDQHVARRVGNHDGGNSSTSITWCWLV